MIKLLNSKSDDRDKITNIGNFEEKNVYLLKVVTWCEIRTNFAENIKVSKIVVIK
jgi:hypothetical protein